MAIEIPTPDGRIFWNGTHAAAVALTQWDRDTTADDRFSQGVAASPGGTAGATTHTHTQSHTHTGVQHRHLFSGSSGIPSSFFNYKMTGVAASAKTHSHANANSAYATLTYSTNSAATDANTADSADPPNRPVIMLKPASGASDLRIPDRGVALTDDTVAPTGFTTVSGLNGRLIKGAGTGNDTDLTQDDGQATHTHGVADHSHTPNAHEHAEAWAGNATSQSFSTGGSQSLVTVQHHGILLDLDSTSDVADHTGWTSGTGDNEPVYTKLLPIENTSGSPIDVPTKTIIPFVGTGTIPTGWALCDGNGDTLDLRSSQIKCTTTGGEVSDTGGVNTHTHTLPDHGHTHSTGHNHTRKIGGTYPGTTLDMGRVGFPPRSNPSPAKNHVSVHTWTINNTVPTMSAKTGHSTGSSDKRGPYRKVLWIQYIGGGLHQLPPNKRTRQAPRRIVVKGSGIAA